MAKFLLNLAASIARLLPDSLKGFLYRLGPISQLIRSSLNRAAPVGLAEVKVAAGGLRGARLLLNMQAEKEYWLGTYETELQAAIEYFVKPGWIAYDVGANIGYVSLLLAQAVGVKGQVFSFEALPENVDRLTTNIALNNLNPRMQVTHAAVGASSTPVRFLIGPSWGMGKAEGSAGRQVEYDQHIEVPGLSLDDFIYQHGHPPPQVIKMDIEGGEVLALPGMLRLLEQEQPLIFMELHGPMAARQVWATLTTAGYRILHMGSGYPALDSLDQLDWKSYLIAERLED